MAKFRACYEVVYHGEKDIEAGSRENAENNLLERVSVPNKIIDDENRVSLKFLECEITEIKEL